VTPDRDKDSGENNVSFYHHQAYCVVIDILKSDVNVRVLMVKFG